MHKDPQNYTIVTYVWVFGLSLFGGLAGYFRKVKAGQITRLSLTELLGEMVISAFVGIVTFYFCEYAQIPGVLSAAFIGIASHMGSRAIMVFENAGEKFFHRYLDFNDDSKL